MRLLGLISAVASGAVKGHFGQWAEDVLVRKLFPTKKSQGLYVDLGAYHPYKHSNTAYFWLRGWHGINVDANPNSIKLFNSVRPADKNLWAAIIPDQDYRAGVREIELGVPAEMDSKKGISATGTVNTRLNEERGFRKKLLVPTASSRSILEDHHITAIDYLNIDVEGVDDIALVDIDLSKLRPTVISIEDYSVGLRQLTESKVTLLLEAHHYELAGRAGPTSIFRRHT
jgi:hypothetical protein